MWCVCRHNTFNPLPTLHVVAKCESLSPLRSVRSFMDCVCYVIVNRCFMKPNVIDTAKSLRLLWSLIRSVIGLLLKKRKIRLRPMRLIFWPVFPKCSIRFLGLYVHSRYMDVFSKANQAVPHQEHRRGAHLLCTLAVESVTHSQCDTRPTVTFPASERHCCLIGTKTAWWTEAHVCEQLAQGCYLAVPQLGVDLGTFLSPVSLVTVRPPSRTQ